MSDVVIDLVSVGSNDDINWNELIAPQDEAGEPPFLDPKDECVAAVMSMFPDICPDYLEKLADDLWHDVPAVSAHIVDQAENGRLYPKRPNRKRKRSESEVMDPTEEALKKYSREAHPDKKPRAYSVLA